MELEKYLANGKEGRKIGKKRNREQMEQRDKY